MAGTIADTGPRGFLHGPVEQWIEQLTELVIEHGMDTFTFGTDGDDPNQIHTVAEQVAPGVRIAAAAHRRTSSPQTQ